MRRCTLFRWLAALMLAIALLPSAVSAQEAGTLTISGLFSMDYMYGESDLNWYIPDLLAVYYNGHEHTWTLTLHGTTRSHYTNGSYYATDIHATSFDLAFFGPDAATLNGIVSEHIAGGEALIDLTNFYWGDLGDFASIRVLVWSPGFVFQAGDFEQKSDTLFPSDAYGYPVVGPEPFSIWSEYSFLDDRRPGNDGWIASLDSLVTLELGSGASCSTFVAPDLDHDCDVDAADMTSFVACASGPGLPAAPECDAADFDRDGDADQTDFAVFQRCRSGANHPAAPNCAD